MNSITGVIFLCPNLRLQLTMLLHVGTIHSISRSTILTTTTIANEHQKLILSHNNVIDEDICTNVNLYNYAVVKINISQDYN